MGNPIWTEARKNWADTFLGTWQKGQFKNQEGLISSYEMGKHGVGIYLLTDKGIRIYKKFPKRLLDEFETSY